MPVKTLNFYSVPYTLVHEQVEVRATPTTVEIFHKGQRVASHLRGRGRGQAFTQKEHRPKSHQAHLEWTPSHMVHGSLVTWRDRVLAEEAPAVGLEQMDVESCGQCGSISFI